MPKRASKTVARQEAVAELLRMVAGKWVTQALAVAAELGVAEMLAKGPKSAPQVARQAKASEDGVYRLMRALGSLGVLREDVKRRFHLTPLGRLLRNDAYGGYARFFGIDATWRPWGDLLYSVRTGKPAFDHVFGESVFEHFANHPEASRTFDQAMSGVSLAEAEAVLAAYDFRGVESIVDVGGGRGLLLANVLAKKRRMRGILLDLPHVVAGARAVLDRYRVAARCDVAEGDFFCAVPHGADAYVLKHVLHDWDDERCRIILGHVREAMGARARLLVIDPVIPVGSAAHHGKLLDLEMLVLTPLGRERTRDELGALLESAGFRIRKVLSTRVPSSIVEAVRSGD